MHHSTPSIALRHRLVTVADALLGLVNIDLLLLLLLLHLLAHSVRHLVVFPHLVTYPTTCALMSE
jgi:hypothetical protein